MLRTVNGRLKPVVIVRVITLAARPDDAVAALVAHLGLVPIAAEVVVELLHRDLRDDRVLRDAERADVHVREVRDVHEVVGHPRRRRPPHLDPGVDPAVRRVVLGSDLGDAGHGVVEAQPHEPIALHGVDGSQVTAWRDRDALGRRRDAHAPTFGAERPAVVAALEAAVHEMAVRERRLAVRAAIGRGDQRAAGSAPDHDVVAEQADGERGVIDVGHLGDDVPETAQRWSVDEH